VTDRASGATDRRVSCAEVAGRDPELIFACWCGKPVDVKSLLERPGLGGVTAVKGGRVHEVPPEIILQPGPACRTDGLDFLERHIADCAAP
jgi:iron complex transport system substrate-binding protein